uniref:Uncharacterized protein n=1 Tax=Rousettus aegyptiacus TaxID=9407 RepID=A0A7J8CIH1_ROUAE|nr:hypothetical protein HJG63_009131 [Rousettus aegyptiacus]
MSQKSQHGHQSTQTDFLPEAPNEDTQEETQDPPVMSHASRVSIQDPLLSRTRPVILQGPPSIIHARRVSIQDRPSIIHTRRVSIQDRPSTTHTRRVSIQDPPSTTHTRRVSIQDPPSTTHTRRVSIQDPPSMTHTRRVSSIQDPPSMTHTRWVSIQDPPSMTHTRRVSIQESPLTIRSHSTRIQETPSFSNGHRVSTEDTPSVTTSHRASIQDTPPVTCSHCLDTQDVSPIFQTHQSSIPSSLLITPISLISIGSKDYTSQDGFQEQQPAPRSLQSDTQSPMTPSRAKVDVPPSITHSPEASIKSFDSSLWTFQDNFQDPLGGFQVNGNIADDGLLTDTFEGASFGRLQDIHRRRHSQLPIGWWLLNKTKTITRELSLALTLACLVIIALICTSQPWIQFQVPLTPPGDPAGNLTIPINTIFFVQCLDSTCMQEHNQNAYLLDFSWAFMLLAGIACFCLCLIIIDSIFFTSSNPIMLDFTSVIISILAGTSMILGILFYLLQAHEYLQEGMTYRLGRSFYLAWIGIFFFLMIGLLSYLNYMNFWSILAIQAIWT